MHPVSWGVPLPLMKAVKKELQDVVQKGVIEQVDELVCTHGYCS